MDNVVDFVKGKWEKLTAFSKKEDVKQRLWNEIERRYSEPHRAYHNLGHIAYLFGLLDSYLTQITNPAVTGFAILYHDIIYDTYRQDNEEQSAAIAAAHLNELQVNSTLRGNVNAFILATKKHEVPEDCILQNDVGFFLDIDMAILGADYDNYKIYSDMIRQEYSQYPDALYREGRKQALEKFLASPVIFATEDFRVVLEETARENVRKEIASL